MHYLRFLSTKLFQWIVQFFKESSLVILFQRHPLSRIPLKFFISFQRYFFGNICLGLPRGLLQKIFKYFMLNLQKKTVKHTSRNSSKDYSENSSMGSSKKTSEFSWNPPKESISKDFSRNSSKDFSKNLLKFPAIFFRNKCFGIPSEFL